jgi:hypothetical protein
MKNGVRDMSESYNITTKLFINLSLEWQKVVQ